MFLVEKTNLTKHFKSFTKHKPIPKHYQSAAQSFDDKIISHLKTLTLTLTPNSPTISFSWMSKAVTFLTAIHSEAYEHIFTKFRSESDCYYMDYTLKVLDLCNLMTSALKEMTEVKMLMKMTLRLLTSTPDKMVKGKDALIRCVNLTRRNNRSRAEESTGICERVDHTQHEKCSRAVDLIREMAAGAQSLPVSKTGSGLDLTRRTISGLGSLTVVIARVLISVLYGKTDLNEFRVTNEFGWADSVNAVQSQLVDQIGINEMEDITRLGVNLYDVIDDVIKGGDNDKEKSVRLDNGIKELGEVVGRFTDGVDELTNGVDCLFSCVMKTRNGVLDGVRKGGAW